MVNYLTPPPLWKTLGEASTIFEPLHLLTKYPELKKLPRGNGEPVLVLPGFGTDDSATWLLRQFLSTMGYQVQGWKLGLNRGHIKRLIPLIKDLVRIYHHFYERPLKLVGWSLGGYLAREAAREVPEWVEQVITMGTPVIGGPKYTITSNWYRLQGYDLDRLEAFIEERKSCPLTVPVTALYSQQDGIVNWEACIDPNDASTTYIEVSTTHFGFAFSPDVFTILARTLS